MSGDAESRIRETDLFVNASCAKASIIDWVVGQSSVADEQVLVKIVVHWVDVELHEERGKAAQRVSHTGGSVQYD
ncbi:uncharacterized protein ARMOST_20141 [Armillaria ostoyae]|uniref:Uncharacterized protein n=1 Tax=Armillaria ostoyae TaxID=47428 RepID=A0A284S6J1_ARMOS|nr:uncharacterized protein ARMOST_20141 [Armillaria ostoyae]